MPECAYSVRDLTRFYVYTNNKSATTKLNPFKPARDSRIRICPMCEYYHVRITGLGINTAGRSLMVCVTDWSMPHYYKTSHRLFEALELGIYYF